MTSRSPTLGTPGSSLITVGLLANPQTSRRRRCRAMEVAWERERLDEGDRRYQSNLALASGYAPNACAQG